MKDIRYCTATDCPFDECESHYSRMKKVKDKKKKVKVANLYSCCRKPLLNNFNRKRCFLI